MSQRDTVSLNSVIAGYINCGRYESAREFFKSMKRNGVVLDGYSFGSVLKEIACDMGLFLGQQVHSDIVKMDYQGNVYAENALLDMYAKCGRVEDGMKVFECMQERHSVSWNALIAGYVEVGDRVNSFWLLNCMKREHVSLDDVLKHGLAHCICNTVYNATITAYSECGSIQDAKRVFDSYPFARDLVTWNAMLAAYIVHEQENNAFILFLKLRELGLTPDLYTYTSIISACFGKPQEGQGKSLHCLV